MPSREAPQMFLTHRGTSKDSHDPLECLGVRREDGEVWIQAVRGTHDPPILPSIRPSMFHPPVHLQKVSLIRG